MQRRARLVLATVLLGLVALLGWRLAASRQRAPRELRQTQAEVGEPSAALSEGGRVDAPRDSGAPSHDAGPGAPPDAARREVLAPAGEEARPAGPQDWLARVRAAESVAQALAIAREIAALEPDEAWGALRAVFPAVAFSKARQQILKLFVLRADHPHTVRILHLGATDPDPAVQGWAFEYLRKVALRDFSGDHSAYLEWSARFTDLPLAEVLRENARELALRLSALHGGELLAALEAVRDLDLRPGQAAGVDLAAVLREAGLLVTVDAWLAGDEPEARRIGLRWLAELDPGEGYLRRSVLPLLQAQGQDAASLKAGACHALGRPGNDWAVDPLLDAMKADLREGPVLFGYARALAEIGDARVVPTLIAMIEAEGTYDTVYGVGYFGLTPLTGVAYHESHDGAFWRAWWQENRRRLPPEVGALDIPDLGK